MTAIQDIRRNLLATLGVSALSTITIWSCTFPSSVSAQQLTVSLADNKLEFQELVPVQLSKSTFPIKDISVSLADNKDNQPELQELEPVQSTLSTNIKNWTDIARNIALIISGLGTLYIAWRGISNYRNDVDMKRITDAIQLYNEFDKDPDCVRAMTMVDYYTQNKEFTFKYKYHGSQEELDVNFSAEALRNALNKPYTDLNDAERAIRFIMDVWLGWFERIFYCVEKGYFKKEELVFYRYWLDHLMSDEFNFVRAYAENNTCGTFIPSLEKYETTIRPQIQEWLKTLKCSTHN